MSEVHSEEAKEALTSPEEINRQINDRGRVIVRASVIGILTNVGLAAFKAAVGLLTHSIAITMDAVNNISDAASSLITIIGTKLAQKEPDKKHPFGYGRIEYMSALIISVIVLYAGISSLVESVKAIIHPDTPDYSVPAVIIVAVAVLVKVILGTFVQRTGQRVNSDSLVASGRDAVNDAVISTTTVIAALLYVFAHISVEAWLGALISLVIVKAGFDMLMETVSKILGESADPTLVRELKKTVTSFEDVSGAYDLVLNNYGPDSYNGSIHIEVPDTYTADQVDTLIRRIQTAVYRKHRVILTGIGIYSVETQDQEAVQIRREVEKLVLSNPYVLQMHGFYYHRNPRSIRFDLVISFESPNRQASFREVVDQVRKKYPDAQVYGTMDTDFTGFLE